MKKKSLLIPLLPIMLLTACRPADNTKSTYRLTYGSQIEVVADDLEELSSDELSAKTDRNECFILAVYQGEYSQDCLCWVTFKTVIANYISNYHGLVYLFNAQEQTNSVKDLNIKKIKESTPMLYVFNGNKQVVSYSYNKAKDKVLFNDTTAKAMDSALRKHLKDPKMFYVDKAVLDKKIESKESFAVAYIRNACEDCKYVIPNVIIPYIYEREYSTKDIYIIDLQYYYDLQNLPEISSIPYDNIKECYKLTESANSSFGYGRGVVPTIQYYEEGELSDSTVYFNDKIAQKEDGSYYVSDSFYSQERLTSIKYANNVEKNVLKGMTLSNDEVISYNGEFYWLQEKAAVYHTPLLEAFLNKYV